MSFNPYVHAGLAGEDSHSWHEGTMSAEAKALIDKAAAIWLRRLEAHGLDPEAIEAHAVLRLGALPHERESGYFFATDGSFRGYREFASGSVGQLRPDVFGMARFALESGADLLIDVHCHPRASIATPSDADRAWVGSAGATLSAARICLADAIVVAGCRTHWMRAEAAADDPSWMHVPRIRASSSAPSTPAARAQTPAMGAEDLATVNLAWLAVAAWQPSGPTTGCEELSDIVRAWLGQRAAPAVGVIAIDLGGRPIACRIVGTAFDGNCWAHTGATKFAIETCAGGIVLAVHAPEGCGDVSTILEAADELRVMVSAYDVQILDVVLSNAQGVQSLGESGAFDSPNDKGTSMKVSDILSAMRSKKEKDDSVTAASLGTIARKCIDDRDLSPSEKALLESGSVDEQQITAAVSALREWDSALAGAVRIERRRREKAPRIAAAQARLPVLQKELVEVRTLAAQTALPPDFRVLCAMAQAHRDLLGPFADEKALEAHVSKLADQPADVRAA